MTSQRGDWTSREELAALAMQGLLANPSGPFQSNPMSGWGLCNTTVEQTADLCFFIADEMLLASVRASPQPAGPAVASDAATMDDRTRNVLQRAAQELRECHEGGHDINAVVRDIEALLAGAA